MPGLGTIINCAGVIGGGILGMMIKKGLSERFQNILIQAVGLCVIFLGISGTLTQMLTVDGGVIVSGGTMMIIFSLALGALLGELLNIEKHTEEFGEWIKVKTGSGSDGSFVDGFVTTSLTICIGAMAVVGAIQDGITGDISMLCAKAVLDAIIVFVMASSMGKGCIFSVIPLGLFQGGITLLSRVIEPLLTPQAVSNMSMVGSMLIFCVGVNLMFQRKIKVANMLPALVFAVACAFLPFF
ncbi:DUF554 domain-containing protein [[Clostridium] symbiosum]|uniref:DUF554 domain-containing protein n=1 Tax=Clostridium symbiosum TaxID=1512 RepID=UPI001D08CB6C|nr:DUF554 domain-containing protein [[Clostridium] symbiosum]MCB6608893.1 DUF554 domain-containing protein [[Clostridium] symbiosum]MCB6930180.1 DUF554 domain-containing protein [[Clostridium] symbiosum]